MRAAVHGHGDVLPVGLDRVRGQPRRSGRRRGQDHGIAAPARIAGGQLPDRPRTTLFQREGVGPPPDPDLLAHDRPRLPACNQGKRNGYAVVVGVGDLHLGEDAGSIGEEPGAEDGGIGVDQQPAPRRCLVARGVDRLDLEQVRPLLQNRLRAAPRFSTALQYPGFPLRAVERQAVPRQPEEVEVGAQGPAGRNAETIEAHLVAVGVGDRSVASGKPLDPVDEQAVAEGGQLVGRGVGAVVPLDGDPDPPVHPHRTGGGEFARSVRTQLQRYGMGASVHAAGVVHRHQRDPLQGRRLRVGYGVVVEQRIYRDVAGVADLQVQVRRSRSAFAAAGDHLPARHRELSFLQPEIDGVAAGFLLRRPHPFAPGPARTTRGGRRRRCGRRGASDTPRGRTPRERCGRAMTCPGGDRPHLVPGTAPGFQVDAGVERGRTGFAEGRGEGGVEVERPQEGRFRGGQTGTGGEKDCARGDRPPDEIRAQAGCRPPGKGPEPAVQQAP